MKSFKSECKHYFLFVNILQTEIRDVSDLFSIQFVFLALRVTIDKFV